MQDCLKNYEHACALHAYVDFSGQEHSSFMLILIYVIYYDKSHKNACQSMPQQ